MASPWTYPGRPKVIGSTPVGYEPPIRDVLTYRETFGAGPSLEDEFGSLVLGKTTPKKKGSASRDLMG